MALFHENADETISFSRAFIFTGLICANAILHPGKFNDSKLYQIQTAPRVYIDWIFKIMWVGYYQGIVEGDLHNFVGDLN